jgi:hypothetical protein
LPPDGAIRILPRDLIHDLDIDVLLIGDGSPTSYRMGNSPIRGNEPLLPFPNDPVPHMLEGSPGRVFVFAKFYDAAGNESDQLSDSVRYEPLAEVTPTPTSDVPTPTFTPTPREDITPTPTTFQDTCPDMDGSGKIDANDLFWIIHHWQEEWPPPVGKESSDEPIE